MAARTLVVGQLAHGGVLKREPVQIDPPHGVALAWARDIDLERQPSRRSGWELSEFSAVVVV
jgi:hypothetical protein